MILFIELDFVHNFTNIIDGVTGPYDSNLQQPSRLFQ